MARLNESTTSTESVEVLKRRFVRQNREIARVNSIQSLRIRSLESEVSHLLAENVSLRERVITLGQEIERFEAVRLFQDGVYNLKAKLDNKLMELGDLVADLGALPRKFNKSVGGATETIYQSRSSLDLRQHTTELDVNPSLQEDGRLPVILEDKSYPRRTLEPQEIQELLNNDMVFPQSSCLEEASISQGDAIFDDPYSKSSEDVGDIQQFQSPPGASEALLPPNLETRRRRKAGTSKTRETVYGIDPEEFPTQRDSGFLLGSGAKRKFSNGTDDELEEVPREEDDFQFSRPTHSPQMTHERLLSARSDHSPVKKQVLLKGNSKGDGRPKRKALEPKSTNICSTEPQNAMTRGQDYKIPERMNDKSDGNEIMHSTRSMKGIRYERLTPNEMQNRKDTDKPKQEVDGDEELQIQPKTTEEKPSSTLASIALSRVQDEFEASKPLSNTSSRPTRRQRSVVSYAEPNLRDKMRRPTDEFIAAVGNDHHSRRTSSTYSVRTTSGDELDEHRSDKINARNPHQSDTEGRGSATVSTASPDKHIQQPANMVSCRQRKTLPASKEETSASHDSTSEFEAYSTVGDQELDGGSKDRHPAEVRLARTKKQKLLSAEGSSDMAMDLSECISGATPVPSRQSRRHSSNPKSFVQNYSPGHETGVSSTEGNTKDTRGSLGNPDGTSLGSINQPKAVMHTSEESALGLGIEVRQVRRVPRAAARRRSMLL